MLLTQLKSLVCDERRITTRILHYLREVEARRLYETRHTSLFEFCIGELGYSNDAAQRRIASMRLLKEMPGLDAKIESGALSLAVVAKAAQFFRQETKLRKVADAPAMNLEEKHAVMNALEGKSKRAVEDLLVSYSVNPMQTRSMKLELSPDDCAKLDQLRALLSHRLSENSVSGVIRLLLEEGLEKHDPARIAARSISRSKSSVRPDEVKGEKKDSVTSAPSARPFYGEQIPGSLAVVNKTGAAPGARKSPQGSATIVVSRYIPADVKRAVWLRDGGRCTAPGCVSAQYIHYDHRIPFALGGASTVENLRLLCAAHNRRAAENAFGLRCVPSR